MKPLALLNHCIPHSLKPVELDLKISLYSCIQALFIGDLQHMHALLNLLLTNN